MGYMSWVWLGATVLFGVVEAATAGLVSIWFAAGSLAALLVTMLGANTTVQIVVFLLVTAATLVLTRPLVKKYQNGKTTPTNADRVLGRSAKVTETIENDAFTGAVYADGKTWTARSTDGSVIPAGEQVVIERMEGVKLFVKLIERTEEVK